MMNTRKTKGDAAMKRKALTAQMLSRNRMRTGLRFPNSIF